MRHGAQSPDLSHEPAGREEEEDPALKSIAALEKETATAEGPGRQILQSITTQALLELLQTTALPAVQPYRDNQFQKEDPATWSNSMIFTGRSVNSSCFRCR